MNSAATRYSLEKSVTNLREIIAVFEEDGGVEVQIHS